jgi:MFS family permease
MGIFGLGGMQAIILGEVADSESSSQGKSKSLRIVHTTHRVAFGWLTVSGSIGFMSGAGLSGYLAEPAGRIPVLGDLAIFKQKPYLLPGLVCTFVAVLAALAVFVFVPEVSGRHDDESPADQIDQLCSQGRFRR